MELSQLGLSLGHELVVDNFAGGGGASTGIEAAIGRPIDVAINHDAEAVAMHAANHPMTKHYCESVFKIDPEAVTRNQPVGLAWFSPDCKHFSKAKGGRPVEKKTRGLAWVVIRWARRVKPRVIMLENVEEFQHWGPLTENHRPCPERRGQTFGAWVDQLRRAGYAVEWRELRACDYGAPTIRKRLFLIARRDGRPIIWPAATHADPRLRQKKLPTWRTAADCIDWSIACPSIFERKKPLRDATCRRIAHGIMRDVVSEAAPFLVPITHTGTIRVHSIREPIRTITTAHRGEIALCAPTLIQTGYGERPGQAPRAPGLHKPLGTIVSGQKHALVAAFLAKHYTGVIGSRMRAPIGTVTATDHHSLVTATLSEEQTEDEHHIDRVRAFLIKYYGSGGQWQSPTEPMHTIPTRDRMGLVTVHGEQYRIADIGMRMLQPRELFRAQGFPENYQISLDHNGKPLTKTAQVRMCGNSVPPPVVTALVTANFKHEKTLREAA